MRFVLLAMESSDLYQCAKLQKRFLKIWPKLNDTVKQVLQPIIASANDAMEGGETEKALKYYHLAKSVYSKLGLLKSTIPDVLDQGDSLPEFAPVPPSETFFAHISGMKDIKATLRDEFVLPLQHPRMLYKPLKGVRTVLLYGPPGCGKTLLAEAMANELKAAFFPILVSDIESKWRGESEKLLSKLFTSIRKHEVAVLFLDEVEALMSERTSNDSLSTMKSLLLQHIDGVPSRSSSAFTVLVCATNTPNQLDKAFLSRFAHMFFVQPPNAEERLQMILDRCRGDYSLNLSPYHHQTLQRLTERYSGRDISSVLNTLNFLPLRRVIDSKWVRRREDGLFEICQEKDKGATLSSSVTAGTETIVRPPISDDDVVDVFRRDSRKPPQEFFSEYIRFRNDHGHGFAQYSHANFAVGTSCSGFFECFTCITDCW